MKSISGLIQNLKVGMDLRNKSPLKPKIRLVGRVYLTNSATTSYAVPYGAKYCVARVLGSGGGNTIDSATPSTGWYVGGGGGAYARKTFKVSAGQSLAVQIGQYSTTTALRVSSVALNGVTKASAEGGYPSLLDQQGLGGTAGIGDEVVAGSGGTGYSNRAVGGSAIGDTSSADSVLCAGNGATLLSPDQVPAGLAPGVAPPRFGGGGAIYYNGSSSTAPIAGAGGLVVLEFYTGDPR